MTVLASQPSVSMETLTTQRTGSPSLPGLPTVFMTSRRRSVSETSSRARPGNRIAYSLLKASISAPATFLNSADMPSPDSSWAESTRIVRGRCRIPPSSSTLVNSGSSPATVRPSRSWPATQSNTHFDTAVLLHTTMKTGGVPSSSASCQASKRRR